MKKKIYIIILLLIAFFISIPTYRFDRGLVLNGISMLINFFWGTDFGVASIRPNIVSMFCAILLTIPLLKKKFFDFSSITGMTIFILDCLCLASLLSCIIPNKTNDFYLIQVSQMSLISVLYVISFFVNKNYIKLTYLIMLISAFFTLPYISRAMGVWGAFFILCSLTAFIMQLTGVNAKENIELITDSDEKNNQINTNERIILSGENTTIDNISKINEKNNEKASK